MALSLVLPFRQQLPSLFAASSSIEFPIIVAPTFPFTPSSNLFATSIQHPLNLTSPGNFQFPTTSILTYELLLLNSLKKPSDVILKTGDSVMSVHHVLTSLKTRRNSNSVCSTPWMETTHSSEFRDVKPSRYLLTTMVLMGCRFLAIQVN